MLSEKIVVIDDDCRIIKSIELLLPEYEIIAFINGEMALDYLKKPNEIGLVLLDFMMPGMDGLEVLSHLKKSKKNIKIILMTAHASKDFLIEALRMHADDLIEKPFNHKELKDKIKEHLKEKIHSLNLSRNHNERIERIKNFVRRNYMNVSLESISDELCLSSKYISRMFNENTQGSFRDFRLEVKMNEAKRLLTESRLNISEIAVQLGYQNSESFMRIFKKITQKTPTQYRKEKSGLKK